MHWSSRAAPLFQIAFNFRVGELLNVKLGDCSLILEKHQYAKTLYDLDFNMTPTDSSQLVEVTSNSDMYSLTTTDWILDTNLHIVQTLASTPSITIGDSQLYDKTQVDNALSLRQGPRVESKWPVSLMGRFYQVCDSFPDTVAIKDGGGFLTYGNLSRRVNTLAAAISRAGVVPSIDTFAAMLGILHVRSIYVPLDITVSSTRQRAMTAVCQPKLAICDAVTAEGAEEICADQHRTPKLNLSDVPTAADENPPKAFGDYGFLLPTSGSTGTPKGVRITQSGIMNYAAAKATIFDLGQVKFLQQSSTGFDLSRAQAFNAIVNAGTLVVAPSSTRGDPARIAELILRKSIQFTIFTPSEYSTLTSYAADTLRPISLSNQLSTTDVTRSIGKPILSTSVYISGPHGEPQPIGFPGEICVGGRGVAMGYFGADSDSAKFLHNPLAKYPKVSSNFKVVYKTGDKGCLRQDGSLVLMGRIEGDTTIKLRGLRIDISEVANSILTNAKGSLTDAVVTIRGTPEFLVACVVLARRGALSPDFLSALRSELPLPGYMISSMILPLDKLPITTNGKVD
ncbi:hypothetical protein N0V90_004504 [Kalmusia sp. IMI 367209]|nr:hypothetical protein N0V90_004504 [Kalmusia sp. IMI 367209]